MNINMLTNEVHELSTKMGRWQDGVSINEVHMQILQQLAAANYDSVNGALYAMSPIVILK